MSSRALFRQLRSGDDELPARRRPARQAVAAVAAAATVFGAAALARHRLLRAAAGPWLAEGLLEGDASGLSESFCSEYPYLKFELPNALVYNNLANKGPDHGNGEGIVYKTIDLGRGAGREFDKEVYLTVNATSRNYRPFSPRLNGMQGKYGSVNLDSGSHVDLEFNFFDRLTMKPLTMPQLALTFFDLDTGNKGTSKEYVEIGGFKSYHLTDETEVQVSDVPGGQKRFTASTVGTGADNPLDPMFLTPQQKNRAVTLLFDKAKTVRATIGAEAGTGPRFFTFVGRPSLLCAVTVQEGFKPPLPDLMVKPPMQLGISGGEDEVFVRFVAHTGQEVKKGDVVAVVKAPNGPERNLVAPQSGKVMAIQDKLQPNDKLRERLDDKTLAIIGMPLLKPLTYAGDVVSGGPGRNGGEGGVLAHSTFVKYLVGVGDTIHEGNAIAVVKSEAGQEIEVHATSWGTVKARQDGLRAGDPMVRSKDMNLISLEPLKPLPLDDHNAQAAVAPPGMEFVGYKVKKGDIVKRGDPIAEIKDGQGKQIIQKATHGGIITDLQDLKPGTPIDRVSDRNLCTTGRFAPLPLSGDTQQAVLFTDLGSGALAGAATLLPEDLKFVKFHVKEGDIVEKGTSIATVEGKDGKQGEVLSPQPGVVKAIQDGLQEGMLLGKVMQDTNIATIGRLPPLEVDQTEKGSFGPSHGSWEFDNWTVSVGDDVQTGDPVAILTDEDSGAIDVVKAGKSGTVTEMQDHLRKGDIVEQATKDDDLVTVGLFKKPELGFRELAVEVPDMDCVFKDWLIEDGDRVHFGDPIAEVETPGRRLVESDGSVRRLAGSVVQIPSPGTGWVSYRADLRPNESIRDQSVSPSIAKVNLGMPWWLLLLGALAALCCCFCCLFKTMQKPKPFYQPMPAEEVKPEPPPEPFTPSREPGPEGLRLDFDDAGTVQTVFAKWRPLGIKHKGEAPIVAHDFCVNSYCRQELGVKEGWKLTRIGDEELNDNPHFEEVNAILSRHLKDFPLWPLALEFRKQLDDPEGITIKFVERPLGVEFSNRAPIHIAKIHEGSPAAEMHVEEGWFLTKIGDYDVHENRDFRDVMKHFKEGVNLLEDNGKKYTT